MNPQLISLLKLYYFGDENISDEQIEKMNDDDKMNFRNALVRLRGNWPIMANLHRTSDGKLCISIDCNESGLVYVIRETLNCTEGCARDIFRLRSRLDWTKEKEEELINYHNAGIPSKISIF